MTKPSRRIAELLASRDGNIAIMAAAALPACIGVTALAVDYGHLTLERRELQNVADLAAIAVASDIAHAEDAAMVHLDNNGLRMAVKTPGGWKSPAGVLLTNAAAGPTEGRLTIEKGHYAPDPALAPEERFKPTSQSADAVRVHVEQPGTLFFASMFTTPPMLSATGTAAMSRMAAFSIGSRLASLEGGLLNAVLGRLLEAKLSFSAVDYRSLAAADVDIFRLARGLATDLNLNSATYDDVLQAELTMPQLLAAVSRYSGIAAGASGLLTELRRAVPSGGPTFSLSQFIDLGQKGRLRVDAGSNTAMKLGLLDLVQSSASVANGSTLVSVQTKTALPGLGTVDIDLAIGEPSVETPPHRVGEPGQAVRTAQVRLSATVRINGVAELVGTSVVLPLYAEVAHSEAKLADIRCHGGKSDNATVTVDAAPGVAEVSIGSVDTKALQNFGSTPRVAEARLVDTPALTIDGMSSTTVGGSQIKKVSFTPANIAIGLTKSVSSSGLATSTAQSLIEKLDLTVEVKSLSGLKLSPPKVLEAALAKTLKGVAPALDTLLDSVLATAGVRVGEADIQVTGVDCANPVLVQ